MNDAWMGADTFVAIDFETADSGRDSACAVGMVRVEKGRIVHRERRFIRPPRAYFEFTYVHGITWARVAREPRFRDLWPKLRPVLSGAEFLVAHQASFDRSVLLACCEQARVAAPRLPFECTVRIARRLWSIRPTRLPNVCSYLDIPLKHHDALSDAEACARIVLAARREAKVAGRSAAVHAANS
jgi:DNA polymerase-3 subunit epsilon